MIILTNPKIYFYLYKIGKKKINMKNPIFLLVA